MQEAALPPPAAAPVPPPAAAPAPPPAAAAPPPAAALRSRLGGLDPATRRQTFVVAAVIAALFWGTQILNEAVPANAKDQAAAGQAVAIGDGARITPLDGWVSSPHESGAGIRLEKGVVVIDLYPETVGGNAGALAAAYLEQVLKDGLDAAHGHRHGGRDDRERHGGPLQLPGHVQRRRHRARGRGHGLFVGGQGVLADAWSGQGDLASLLGEVHGMLQTIEVGS